MELGEEEGASFGTREEDVRRTWAFLRGEICTLDDSPGFAPGPSGRVGKGGMDELSKVSSSPLCVAGVAGAAGVAGVVGERSMIALRWGDGLDPTCV